MSSPSRQNDVRFASVIPDVGAMASCAVGRGLLLALAILLLTGAGGG